MILALVAKAVMVVRIRDNIEAASLFLPESIVRNPILASRSIPSVARI